MCSKNDKNYEDIVCVQRKIRITRHCVCVQKKIRITRHCVCSKKDKNYETLCVFKER